MAFEASLDIDFLTGRLRAKGLQNPVDDHDAIHKAWLESYEMPLTQLGSYARGNLIVGGVSDWEALTIEPAGQILMSTGTYAFWSSIFDDQHAPTGFEDRSLSTITWNDGDMSLTVAPTGVDFVIYSKGVRFVKTLPQHVHIIDVEGVWYIYYNSSGFLSATKSIWNFRDHVPVSIIYWDATNNVALDYAEERHGMTMDGDAHSYLHYTVGTRFESGLAAGDYTLTGDGSADADAQLSIADGIIRDEDLQITITDGSPQDLAPIAQIPVYYLDGAALWRKTIADDFPVMDSATDEISYNLDTAGTWSQPPATSNYYVAIWIFASTGVTEPVVAVLGQRQDSKLDDARVNNTYESLVWNALPFQEMKVIFRLIFNTRYPQHSNTPHCKLVDIVDLRSVSNLPAGTYVATAHSSLTGRDARASHPATAVRVDLTNMDQFFSSLVPDVTDDVQNALELVDEIFNAARTVTGDWMWSNNFRIEFYDTGLFIRCPADSILELSADGHVRIGSNAQTHLTGTADSLLVSGKLEIDSTAYFDSSVEMYNQVTFFNATNSRIQFYETGVSDGAVYETRYDTDQHLIAVGAPAGRQVVICDAAYYTRDFDHAVQTNPTLYVQSPTDPNIANDEWWSIAHDTTDAVYSVGSGVHKFNGDMLSHTSGRHYFDAGAAAGTEFITSGANDFLDLHFNDADAGARFYSAANLLLTIRRQGAGTPTLTHIESPAQMFTYAGGDFRWYRANALKMNLSAGSITFDSLNWFNLHADNMKMRFGADYNAYAYFDGSHFILDPDPVTAAAAVYIGATADDPVHAGTFALGTTPNWSLTYSTDAVYDIASGLHKFTGGNIEISGTSAPMLHLRCTTSNLSSVRLSDAVETKFSEWIHHGSTFATDPDEFWMRVYDGADLHNVMKVLNTGGVESMVMAEDGWIGIGAAAPRFTFDGSAGYIYANNCAFGVNQLNAAFGAAAFFIDQADGDQPYIRFYRGTVAAGRSGADEYLKIQTPGGVRYLKCYT